MKEKSKTILKYSAATILAVSTALYCYFHDHAIGSINLPGVKRLKSHRPVIGCLKLAVLNPEMINQVLIEEFNSTGVDALLLSIPGFTYLCINDPKSVEHVLHTNFDNYVKGDLVGSRLADLFGHGIFAVDGPQWYMQRKTAAKVFTTRAFKNLFDTVFVEKITLLEEALDSFVQSGKKVDMHDLFHRYFLDSFAKIAFGVSTIN